MLYNNPDIRSFLLGENDQSGRACMKSGYLIKNVLVNKINKTRHFEQPKTRQIDVFAKDLSIIDPNAALETRYQRDGWRVILMVAS